MAVIDLFIFQKQIPLLPIYALQWMNERRLLNDPVFLLTQNPGGKGEIAVIKRHKAHQNTELCLDFRNRRRGYTALI